MVQHTTMTRWDLDEYHVTLKNPDPTTSIITASLFACDLLRLVCFASLPDFTADDEA